MGEKGRQCVRCVHGPTESGLSPPGFSSPCAFVAAVSGANGSILWEKPAAQDVALMECAIPQPRDSGASSACILMGRPGSFIAVNSFTGRPVFSVAPPGLLRWEDQSRDASRRVSLCPWGQCEQMGGRL